MLLQVVDKYEVISETGAVVIDYVTLPKGLGRVGSFVLYAYFDMEDEETPLYAYAYAKLEKKLPATHPYMQAWAARIIRPFVAEQMIHPFVAEEIGYAYDTVALSSQATMYARKVIAYNRSLELELAYRVLSNDITLLDLHVTEFQIADEATRVQFLQEAYMERDRVQAAREAEDIPWTYEYEPIDLADLLEIFGPTPSAEDIANAPSILDMEKDL